MAYCHNCGKKLPEDALFCPNCGVAVALAGSPPAYSSEMREALSKMSQEMEKALSIAAREVQEAFQKARNNVQKSINKEPTVCMNCAEKNPAGSVYCSKCGSKISQKTS